MQTLNTRIAELSTNQSPQVSAYDFLKSKCKLLFSLKSIANGFGLVMVGIVIPSLDFNNKWTWFMLALVAYIGIKTHGPQKHEAHKALLAQLKSLFSGLQIPWNSFKSNFQKKNAYCDAILSATTEICGATRDILLRIPDTQQALQAVFYSSQI